jgi:hypothetical protein
VASGGCDESNVAQPAIDAAGNAPALTEEAVPRVDEPLQEEPIGDDAPALPVTMRWLDFRAGETVMTDDLTRRCRRC